MTFDTQTAVRTSRARAPFVAGRLPERQVAVLEPARAALVPAAPTRREEGRQHDVYRLWDDLARFGAASAMDALQHLLLRLCGLVDAQRAYWVGVVRMKTHAGDDPAKGWRLRALHRSWGTAEHERLYQAHWQRIEAGRMDPLVAATLSGAGHFRVNSLRQLVNVDWESSECHAVLYEPMQLRDVIHVGIPISAGVECWIGLERIGQDMAFFSADDREVIAHALRPLKWFQQQVVLHRGVLLDNEGLTPAENRLLCALLSDKTEQQIADELKLSPTTVHTYCTRICRKFGVRGRTGLVALWLGNPPQEAAERLLSA